LYADGCERYYESRRSDRAWEFVERIISAGPLNSSRPRDCSPWIQPGSWRANPDEETTDWRAVCGRTARTVRRAGTARAVSDPYRTPSLPDHFSLPECHFGSLHLAVNIKTSIVASIWPQFVTFAQLNAARNDVHNHYSLRSP